MGFWLLVNPLNAVHLDLSRVDFPAGTPMCLVSLPAPPKRIRCALNPPRFLRILQQASHTTDVFLPVLKRYLRCERWHAVARLKTT